MNSYINRLIESKRSWAMNDHRTIITDRMGNWSKQDVVLTWEGDRRKEDGGIETISITPDEAESLFEKGVISNVARGEDGKLYVKSMYLDIRSFNGAIVCGILAPTIAENMRKEIKSYAKKMGYIFDTMTPVKMCSGTKSLIFNSNGTYGVLFCWHESIVKQIEKELLKEFTRNFFRNYTVVAIKDDGILLNNLSEYEVFSRENIDDFREYDIQLKYLNPEFDKILLLRAVMQRAFIHLPCNLLRENRFGKRGGIEVPENKKNNITFNEFGNIKMSCGLLHYSREYQMYTYTITVPYTEYIRELMIDAEKLLQAKYNVYVNFDRFGQSFSICCNGKKIGEDIERDFISIDYAMRLLQEEKNFNDFQLYSSIISMLESDSTGWFRYEYFSYLSILKHELADKW